MVAYRRHTLGLFVLSLTCFLITTTVSSSYADNDTPAADTLLDTDDGPHLFRPSDTSAIIFYLCHDTIDSLTCIGSDSLRFHGLCGDSQLSYTVPAGHYPLDPDTYDGISKILAVSDIHGEYAPFVEILKNSGVIDENGHWTWGDGHLVVNGDVFDRGDRVTECLWLIHRLEREARQDGGRVHLILGNHELMVLRDDLRYVHQRYLDGIVKKTRITYSDLYGPDMQLGRWLRTKHTAVRINDILYVHGGLIPEIMARYSDIHSLNDTVRSLLDLTSSKYAFHEQARFLFGSKGPFWYRGFHYDMEDRYNQASAAQIDSLLNRFSVAAFVVGHTELDRITSLYDGRVIAIDVPVEDLHGFQALLWENGQFYTVTPQGKRLPVLPPDKPENH